MTEPATRTGEPTPKPDAEAPSILSKAFDLLGAFNHHSRVLTLTEIAKASGLPKSTVHRLLAKLIPMGVIEEHGNAFRVGIRLLPLVAAMPVESMRDRSLPFLAKLHSWSQANVHFAVLRYPDIVLLETFTTVGSKFRSGEVGVRMSANTTALGKAMLAYLPAEELQELQELWPPKIPTGPGRAPIDRAEFLAELQEIRSTGIGFQRGFYEPGLGNVAAPVIIRRRAMASVSVQFDMKSGCSNELIDAVTLTAKRIATVTAAMLDSGHSNWFPFEI
jgi:DNA-binding IclR family transcriptional regulator